jgi:hypothetical protein
MLDRLKEVVGRSQCFQIVLQRATEFIELSLFGCSTPAARKRRRDAFGTGTASTLADS